MKLNSYEHYEKNDFACGRSIFHNLPGYNIIKKGRREKISKSVKLQACYIVNIIPLSAE